MSLFSFLRFFALLLSLFRKSLFGLTSPKLPEHIRLLGQQAPGVDEIGEDELPSVLSDDGLR